MLEKEAIQQTGFRNIQKNGKVTGFQVGYRSTYYRGIWFSMSLGFDVKVDGEAFPREKVTVSIGGKTYTQEEMKKIGDVQWPMSEAAILNVDKPDGLKPGMHEVEISWGHRASYMPPVRPGGRSMGMMGGSVPLKRSIALVV